MKTIRILPFVLLALGVVGCASTKQTMPEAKYYEFVHAANAGQKCSELGYFSAEESSVVIAVYGQALNSWAYDEAKILQIARETPVSVDTALCKKILVDVYVTKQKWEQARQVQYQPTPIPVTQPKNTFCNRVGTQLLCNSF